MTSASDIAAAIGPPLLRTVVDGARQQVRDVFLAEPHEPALAAEPGDLVLGVGLEGPEQALSLVRRCSDVRASGLVLRTALAGEPLVTTAAEQSGLTLLEIGEGVSWAHLVWLVTSIVDRSVPSGGSSAPGVHNDMFALADTVAAIVDAPVTIEDNRSRVLAYSSGQGHTDTARVATIVGRRVPEDVAAHYRSLGVFRRLASSDEPFVVPEGPDGIRPRLIVPVRAGGEWLGSIWIVVEDTVPDDVMADLRKAASVLTLHLLRLRAQSDVARRSAIDLLRSVLWQYSPEKAAGLDLPGPEPWRVVALRAPTDDIGADESVHLWQTVMQRHGWASPGLADLDGVALAVVGNGTAPGSWEWLRQLVAQAARPASAAHEVWAALAGRPATVAELPRSRAEAMELFRLHEAGVVTTPVQQVEDAWATLTIHRAAAAVDLSSGPVAYLDAHDDAHGTGYVLTLNAWLRHHGEPRRAAAELMVHPNTLRYRIRRLRQILRDVVEIDLDDPDQRLALQIQIAAVRSRT